MEEFPCKKCCELDLSCCHNPQITWTIEEFDKLVTVQPDVLERVVVLKGDLPGLIYILDKETALNPDKDNNIALDYCAFYDTINNCCSIYEHRPVVCSTYGDPKYNACPYDGMTDESLEELSISDPDLASKMHKTAFSNPGQFGEDFILPFVIAFKNSEKDNPEYMKWWQGLPNANFIRK